MNTESTATLENDGSSSGKADRSKSLTARQGNPSSLGNAPNRVASYGGPPSTARNDIIRAEGNPDPDANEAFKARCRQYLGPGLPLDKRLSFVHIICNDVQHCSPDALNTLWQEAQDLTEETAPLEARRAGFALLEASVAHSINPSRRQSFFDLIIIPVRHSEVGLQIKALDRLTSNGRNLVPFESELVVFLNQLLKDLFPAVERAREERFGNIGRIDIWSDTLPKTAAHKKDQHGLLKQLPGEEKALFDTMYLIADIIGRNPDAFHHAQLEIMLQSITSVAKKTTMRRAILGTLKIISAVVENAQIPSANLRSCVFSICAVLGSPNVPFGDKAWYCLSKLLRSQDRQITYDILMQKILNPPEIPDIRGLTKFRGAILSIQRIAKDAELTSSLVIDLHSLALGLQRAYAVDTEMQLDTLQTINALLSNDTVCERISQEPWHTSRERLSKLARAGPKAVDESDALYSGNDIEASSPFYDLVNINSENVHEVTQEVEVVLELIANRILFLLEGAWQELDQDKWSLTLKFLLHLGQSVPYVWEPIVRFMWERSLLHPACENWKPHLGMVLTTILLDPSKPELARCLVLEKMGQLYPLLREDATHLADYTTYLRSACQTLRAERDVAPAVVNALADLAVELGTNIDLKTFDVLLGTIEEISRLPSQDLAVSAMIPDRVPDCLIRLFLKCFQQSAFKTIKLYKMLVCLSASPKPTSMRLSAIKLLTRLRCNSNFGIKIVAHPDTQNLASILCRTQATAFSNEPLQTASSRTSTHGQSDSIRTGRSSAVDSARPGRSRSGTRSINAKDRLPSTSLPLWMYDGSTRGLPEDPPIGPSLVIYANRAAGDDTDILDLSLWMDVIIDVFQNGNDWEIYSYILVHSPSQLSNYSLFAHHVSKLQILHNLVCLQLNSNSFYEPPFETGIKRGDVALCLYGALTMLMAYHECFSRREKDDTVRTFRTGIEKWDRTGKCCIHALALCCYEMPLTVQRQIVNITEMMQKRITQADLAMDILEFLGGLVRLQDAYGDADIAFYQKIFGISVRYLQYAREQRRKHTDGAPAHAGTQPNLYSGNNGEIVRPSALIQSPEVQKDLSEYVYTLAYQIIIFWFLSIDVRERAQHVGWLAQELTFKDDSGREIVEEQSLVILDLMHRTAFSNLGETVQGPDFLDPSANIIKKMWLEGMSIITTKIIKDGKTDQRACGQLTKRQASGTTHAIYFHNTAELPSHHVQNESTTSRIFSQRPLDVYPNHMFLQLTSTISPIPIPLQPMPLPEDDFTRRAIKIFDSIDTVDGHKAGIVYIKEGQTTEADILANTHGTDAYEAFLSRLGTKVSLKDAKFNVQGLDRQTDEDGTHTYAWRDRIAEIVFHISTMMPTDLTDDPQGNKKKRHIGNDHVKIIFNDSGMPYHFNTLTTALNSVNVVISPEAHTCGRPLQADRTAIRGQDSKQELTDTDRFGFYNVQTICSSSYPQISPAASPKIVSADVLPAFVRQIVHHASVFCQVWEDRGQEHISSWRARLREIMRLRQRYANTNTSANVHYPMAGSESAVIYKEGDTWTGNITTGGMAERDQLLRSLDFTRWT